jgi:prepilin-type N-terminal cleavage/methylation domain-containing protein
MKRRNSAFTLVELLIVITIIAILAIILTVVGVGGYLAYDYMTDDEPAQVEQVEEENE